MGGPQVPWEGTTQSGLLKKIAPDITEYCEWYCENGYHLPDEFKTDPSSWTQIVREIGEAFELIMLEDALTEDEEKKVDKGVDYFYKYFKELGR